MRRPSPGCRLHPARELSRSRHSGSGRLHRRRRPKRPGPRSRRLGHRRDEGPADEVREDRRHRRRGPVHAAGTARRELRRVGAGLRPGRFGAARDEAHGRPGHAPGNRRNDSGGSGEGLSRRLLAVADGAAGREPVPRHRRRRQRHGNTHAVPGPLARLAEVGLQLLPPTREPPDSHRRPRVRGEAGAHHPQGSLGVAAGHRGARQPDVQRAPASGHGSVPGRVRGLDRADRGGRTAAGADAAAGDRAQPRSHPVGRRQRQDVHARSRVDRQEQPPDQRRRTRSTRRVPATASSWCWTPS